MNHILISSDNIKRTGEDTKLNCIFCNKKTKHKVGYMGSVCLECGLEMFDLDSWDDVYKHMKNKYHLQRKDVAKLLNLKPSTISTYQKIYPGRLVKDLLDLHYKGKIKEVKKNEF